MKPWSTSNTHKLQAEKHYSPHLVNYVKQTSLALFFLFSAQFYAQEDTKLKNFGIHAGVNSGILSGGIGPSFSFHYALRTEKVVQLESMLFYDSHSGSTFLSGESQKNSGFGVAAGARINISPQKNWNPSLVIMPGVIHSSEIISSDYDNERSGISGALCLAISNAFYRKHMVSIGLNEGKNITAAYLKYGFWF